jgi:hypothetical protein
VRASKLNFTFKAPFRRRNFKSKEIHRFGGENLVYSDDDTEEGDVSQGDTNSVIEDTFV